MVELTNADLNTAKKNKDSSPDEIAKLPEQVQNYINQYKSLKAVNYKDNSLETTFANVKLNPELLVEDPAIKSYLLRTAILYNSYYGWDKSNKGYLPLSKQIIDYFRKTGSGIYDAEIAELEDGLNRGEKWNYSTTMLMKKRLEYLKSINK